MIIFSENFCFFQREGKFIIKNENKKKQETKIKDHLLIVSNPESWLFIATELILIDTENRRKRIERCQKGFKAPIVILYLRKKTNTFIFYS